MRLLLKIVFVVAGMGAGFFGVMAALPNAPFLNLLLAFSLGIPLGGGIGLLGFNLVSPLPSPKGCAFERPVPAQIRTEARFD